MGRRSSEFSEAALRRSRAEDRRRAYNEAARTYGSSAVDWGHLSAPYMSKPIGNRVVIRQVGRGSESTGYDVDRERLADGASKYSIYDTKSAYRPRYEKIGVESVMDYDPETGALSQSDVPPRQIRFVKSMIPKSYTGDINQFMHDWASMVRDKDRDLPDIGRMPFMVGDPYIQDHRGMEFGHEDAGETYTPKSDMGAAVETSAEGGGQAYSGSRAREAAKWRERNGKGSVEVTESAATKDRPKKVVVKVRKPEEEKLDPKVEKAVKALMALNWPRDKAIEAVKGTMPEVDVSDVSMKDISGYRSNCDRIRRHFAGRSATGDIVAALKDRR